MRNTVKIVLIAMVLTLAVSPLVAAQEDDGDLAGAGSVFQFGTDAHSLAMGGAYVAVADNYSATYWNPAGLAQKQGAKLGGMNLKPFNLSGLNYTYGGGSYTFDNFAVGGGYGRLSANLAEDNYAYNHTDEYGSYSENLMVGSLGFGIDLFDIGANVKSYSSEGNSGFGFDLGMLASFDSVKVGVAAADIGGVPLGNGNIEPAYRAGVAIPLMDVVLLSGQFDMIGSDTIVRTGMEVKPLEQLALRGGLQLPSAEDMDLSLSAGAGLHLAGLTIDLAWVQNNTEFSGVAGSGDTLVLSAGFQFGGEEE
ncbi:MAG: hypothetical protein ACOCZX_02245 [Candidatus Bipolaricaulota bacterium]